MVFLMFVDMMDMLVDGLVVDYFYFVQYGYIILIYEGFSDLMCFCCMDRNWENVRMLLGFFLNNKGKQGFYFYFDFVFFNGVGNSY